VLPVPAVQGGASPPDGGEGYTGLTC
jgi:hypothetical protein